MADTPERGKFAERISKLELALKAILALPETDGEDTAAGHWFRTMDIARAALKQGNVAPMKTNGVVLATNGQTWAQLTLVEDIAKTLQTERLTPKSKEEKTVLRNLVGIPVMYDKKGNVWPAPAEGWSLWCAEPWKENVKWMTW